MRFYERQTTNKNRMKTKIGLLIMIFLSVMGIKESEGQTSRVERFSISYLGEMATHPGVKVGFDYCLRDWSKVKGAGKPREREISKEILVSPALGYYFHRRYQSGLFFMPELIYSRMNPKGLYYDFGLGVGYLRTMTYHSYKVDEEGNMDKSIASFGHLSSSVSVAIGKDLSVKRTIPIALFVKPQFMYAVPNFNNGTTYFLFQIGVKYKFKKQ